MTPKTFKIKSFGCQMNVYDGERMAELLGQQGMAAAADDAEADLVVLNTCHIREKAAEKAYSDIGRLKRDDGSRPLIALAGCVAQAEGRQVALIDTCGHRHQLDGRHAEPLQMLDDPRMRQRGDDGGCDRRT